MDLSTKQYILPAGPKILMKAKFEIKSNTDRIQIIVKAAVCLMGIIHLKWKYVKDELRYSINGQVL